VVPGGAAEQACAVEPGHQIIAIGDNDVSSSTLEEVRRSTLCFERASEQSCGAMSAVITPSSGALALV
jgi:hypothetical protein